ncbi:phage-related hypothetical protein [Caenispirillum salinarum AK4]|uniref:Reverse transcriptase domain-containing protein n=1 Tax=Caenispirillum salinarum AK4 TaxID=1238182 RepID=K9GYV3_9PROT|nr:RNA-directed DNA polymerase [Caenispirillum salinarum]EKV29959.1 phage-related hypothetical protein [Caenispirillum salinarum AK4]
MNPEVRLKALVARGYLPRELPPAFTSRPFGEHVHDILLEWERLGVFSRKTPGKVQTPFGKKFKSKSYSYKLTDTESELISKPKRGYERRSIYLTHPVPQAVLSLEIARNWKIILKWLSRRRYSLDRLQFSGNFSSALDTINFAAHAVKKSFIQGTSDWIVKTDINRFYPTIYTHSISWAAYGKEKVKQNINLYSGSLADRLDGIVRACNRNQTVGIPIGPETSRVIAEIISARIDDDFTKICPDVAFNFADRLQDDWFVGLETLEHAERVLASISSAYRGYGLEINGTKTSVERVISSHQLEWKSELSAFLSHRPGTLKGSRLKEFLALSLKLQADNRSESVVGYTISILENRIHRTPDPEEIESFLLKAAVVSPVSMDRICSLLLNIDHHTKRISRKRVGQRFTRLAERALINDNMYELIWLIYSLRGLHVPLRSKEICDGISEKCSSVTALLLLDMKKRGLCQRPLPEGDWVEAFRPERVDADWVWLLAYESIRLGWLPDPKNLMDRPFFKAMNSRGVYFFDTTKKVYSTKYELKRRKVVTQRKLKEVHDIMRVLRSISLSDLDFEDYA